ncbi:MAG: hypothetical protein WD200_02490 [Candidatus Andersenbacteria bacterium]
MTIAINIKLLAFAVATIAAIGLFGAVSAAQACGPHDLTVTKTGPATVQPGEVLTYTVRATALPATKSAAVAVTVVDNVPAGLVFRPQDTKFTWAGLQLQIPSCKQEGGNVVCVLGAFSGDAKIATRLMDVSLSFDVPKSLECATLTNVARISARTDASKGEKNLDPSNDVTKPVITKVACPTPTPTPTPTPSPTPTPTPTPTPEPKNPGINVEKTDNREITRPGHTLSYSIEVENTGDQDLQDIRVTDEVPSQLIVSAVSDSGSIDGQTVVWSNVSLEAGQKKSFAITVKVRDNTKNGHILHNVVTAKSDDHDVEDEATDDTRVEKTEVKGTTVVVPPPVAVPVTAKTGAGIVALVSIIGGASGLATTLRKKF